VTFIGSFAVLMLVGLSFYLTDFKKRPKRRQKRRLIKHYGLNRIILKAKRKQIMKTIRDAKTFDELLDIKYGKLGTEKRDEFEVKAKSFVVGEMIKEARKDAHLTQDALAKKTGTKKSYISRLENGKIDIQISTLFKIFEEGLGKSIGLTIQ
jgi:ribosome-binding protein aMBF1 (putative translation factor)